MADDDRCSAGYPGCSRRSFHTHEQLVEPLGGPRKFTPITTYRVECSTCRWECAGDNGDKVADDGADHALTHPDHRMRQGVSVTQWSPWGTFSAFTKKGSKR